MAQIESTYNTFSGSDIKCTFQGNEIGSLQGFSYSVSREKAPIYTLGDPNPKSFSRGKRGIAGSLVFVVYDRHALLSAMSGDLHKKFSADITEIIGLDFSTGLVELGFGDSLNTPGISTPVEDFGQRAATPFYSDQIPPFDIVAFAANESGANMKMIIKGVEILNEGSGVSIDDIVTEQSFTFVARAIIPWHRLANTPGITSFQGGSN